MLQAVPTFYLYGEPRRTVDERFVHVEALVDRTRPSEWTIRPHAHAELNHIFLVSAGGGALRADARTLPLAAPCLVLVPAGVVHGFRWDVASAGSVVTLASAYREDFVRRDGDLARLFEAPAVLPDPPAEAARAIAALDRELGWAAPGHGAAADAHLAGLLVAILRHMGPPAAGAAAPHRVAALVAQLRGRIEARYRLREPVEAHARALGVSTRRLRAACAAVARQSPADMLDQRAVLEAKRALLYGTLSVAEIGYGLGFADPAYFNRFFRRHAGVAPGAFRRARGEGTREETREGAVSGRSARGP